MNIKHIGTYLMACSLVVVLQPLQGVAQQTSGASTTSAKQTPAERDVQHDFDFEGDPLVVEGSLQQLDHRRSPILRVPIHLIRFSCPNQPHQDTSPRTLSKDRWW